MKPKVLVTRKIPESGIDLLKNKFELEINPENRVMKKEEIIKKIKGKEILLCLLTDMIDAEIMDASPNLKLISNYAVGYNNIDVEAATKRGILVTNTPGVLTETTADMAFTLLMAVARRIPEADKFTREGRFEGWDPLLFLGQDIYGKTLGIIGLGRIGSAMAKRAGGFSMKIIYHDEKRNEEMERATGARFVDMDALLRQSDFISIHTPLLPSTKHLISEKEFSMMKKTACIINTARGPVMDEKALIKALQDKRIFGAGLDVYEYEPQIPNELKKLDNVVIVPHIASATIGTRSLMSDIAAKNIMLAFEGKMPVSLVNKEALDNSRIKISG